MTIRCLFFNAGLIAGLTFSMFFFSPLQCLSQDKGTFTDKRDHRQYYWMKFGKQAWMTGNLNFSTPSGSWTYNNDSINDKIYGRLYDYKTALTVCPKGWHLPADAEWETLVQVLGGENIAGEALNSMDTVGHGAGFKTAMPTLLGGVRHADSTFTGIGIWGGLWSATPVDNESASNILFAKGSKALSRTSQTKGSAFAVRCVRNK